MFDNPGGNFRIITENNDMQSNSTPFPGQFTIGTSCFDSAHGYQFIHAYTTHDYRIFYRHIPGMNTQSDWLQVFPDYKNISLSNNGYIIFTNGLILQWGDFVSTDKQITTLINAGTFHRYDLTFNIALTTNDYHFNPIMTNFSINSRGAYSCACKSDANTFYIITDNIDRNYSFHISWFALDY